MSRKTAASSPAAPRLPGLLRFSGRAAAAGAPLGAEAIRLARSLGSAGARGRAGRRIAWAMLIALALWCLWVRADLAWNGPHMDELDYLYVGGLLLAGETWPTQTYVFSSDLPLWILALGERLGGGDFLGARAAVALLGLLSLGFLWRAAERAFRSWAVAGWATLLVAISPSHLFISRLATYDAVCFLFLAASLDALSYAYARRSLPAAALASGLMALAALAKYPAAACAAVGALALLGAPRLCLVFVGGLGATLGLYGFLERGELAVLVERQLLGTHQPNATSAEVLLTALAYLWPWLLLGLLGLIEAAPAWRLRAAVLASGAVPLVAYHLHGLNLISLYKHLVFSVLFLSPAAALALARLGKQGARGLLVAALVTLAVAVQSAVQVRAMEQAFPDVRPAIEVLERHVGPSTRILSEDPYLPRYVFAGRLDADQIAETTWFDADGDGTRSDADVAEALESGRFDLVLLTGAVSPKLHDLLAGGVLESRYERLYSQPFVATAVMNRQRFGFLEIYRRRGCRNCTAAMRTFMSEHDSSLGEGARDP